MVLGNMDEYCKQLTSFYKVFVFSILNTIIEKYNIKTIVHTDIYIDSNYVILTLRIVIAARIKTSAKSEWAMLLLMNNSSSQTIRAISVDKVTIWCQTLN